MTNTFRRAIGIWRKDGLRGLRHGLSNLRRNRREAGAYRRWMRENVLTSERREDIRQRSESLIAKPLISVVLPVFDVDERWLRRCIESVLDQVYDHWELCIADDASPAPHVRRVLEEYSGGDSRIKVVFRRENGHISAASNSALKLATGEFVVLLDHDDELSADALFWVANEINHFPDTDIIYSDEDLIDENGRRFAPKFKPDFSQDLYYSLNLLTHLSAFRTDVVRSVGGFRVGFEGSQDYDLGLRVLERTHETRIRHIPRVLYHWRVIRGSVAFSMDEKPYAHERARRALREHFERTGVRADVHESFHNLHRVSYVVDDSPAICVISVGPSTNAVEMNALASRSSDDVLLFLEVGLQRPGLSEIEELARFALQTDIGAAGGRILCRDLFVEEAGLVLGWDLSARAAHRSFSGGAPGNMYRNRQISNYSAISISCLAIRRRLFEEMDGFDASTELFDVDLCLRLRELGKRIVVLPHVELLRVDDGATRRVSRDQLAELRKRWPAYVDHDPFCNPNLKRDGSFEIDA